MSNNKLFRFPKPEWLNTPNTRTAGVYLAGALVHPPLSTMLTLPLHGALEHHCTISHGAPLTGSYGLVFPWILLLHRRLHLLPFQSQWQRRPHQFRGLDTGHLLGAWNAGHQFH